MVAPSSLKNTLNQSIDTIHDSSAAQKIKLAVGSKTAGGLTAGVSWQGVATHTDADTFDGSDGVVVVAGVDGSTVEKIVASADGDLHAETRPSRGSLTDRSGAIATGGTRQEVCAANTARKYFLFVNISDTTMWINFGVVAVADKPSFPVAAGGSFVMEASFVSTQLVDVMCATTGKKFVAKEA